MTAPTESTPERRPRDLAHSPAFIERQFPVSKLSKESYKERKAGAGQTLTGLGKWWGRKPLVLVRAAILGLLLPATDDPAKDRETFLALMTMDEDGLLRRLKGSIPASAVYEHATGSEREGYFTVESSKAAWRRGVAADDKRRLQRLAFRRMSYDQKLKYCLRPEEVVGPSLEAWGAINSHLNTNAWNLPDLVRQLGERRFGHAPRVGDVFSGGGSIPFEAARIGCSAYGSDLSPVATLLTWGSLNIVGGDPIVSESVRLAQSTLFERVRERVVEWGIEQNSAGWCADAYLYCSEVLDPTTGWRVPLASSWVIARAPRVVARLVPNKVSKRFDIQIVEDATAEELQEAEREITWRNGNFYCPVDRDGVYIPPARRVAVSAASLRRSTGLRRWEAEDVGPRISDVFQERLYCVRWFDSTTGRRRYLAPDADDKRREERIAKLLSEHFAVWQQRGYIPSAAIQPGDKTIDLIAMRGWTYWHHLFNQRQLLTNGLFGEIANSMPLSQAERAGLLLAVGRIADWNSRRTRWDPTKSGGSGGGSQTFYDRSLSPIVDYNCRPTSVLVPTVCADITTAPLSGSSEVRLSDARATTWPADIWITDPGYADAVNYEELSEFFLAWYEKGVDRIFSGWITDSRRSLAVRGRGEQFRQAIVSCYRATTDLLNDQGFQVVMFTHQDADVGSHPQA